MKQVCHAFGTTVSKAWKSKCKKMDIKTIGINNERPLFYVTLALFLLSSVTNCVLLSIDIQYFKMHW